MRPVHHFSWNPLLRGTFFLNLAMWKCEAQHSCWLITSYIIVFSEAHTYAETAFIQCATPHTMNGFDSG